MILRLRKGKVLVYADDLSGGDILGCETIASADDHGCVVNAIEAFFDIEEQGLAIGAGFLGAVEDSDTFRCLGHSGEEMPG